MKPLHISSLRGKRQQPCHKHGSALGFTQLELVVAMAILAIFATLATVQMFSVSKPLQNATNQLAGILKQVRMRAIVTTSAHRLRLTTDNRGFIVERAATRGCGSTALLATDADAGDTLLRLSSVQGFFVDDELRVGTDLVTNNVIAVSPGANTITLGTPLGTNQVASSVVELANNWQSDTLATGFAAADLSLPQPRNPIFGGFNESQTTEVRVVAPAGWTLCLDSRGVAQQFNIATGQPIPGNLNITLQRFNTVTNMPLGNQSQVLIQRGGALSYEFAGTPLADTTRINE
jgi:prepilin-type N-terminal cleavage/methylation domain-containing protein